MKYFFADYEKSLYGYDTFFRFFKDFSEKANFSGSVSKRTGSAMSFKDWKTIKRHLLPFKVFNKNLVEKVSAQKFYSSNVSPTLPNVSLPAG